MEMYIYIYFFWFVYAILIMYWYSCFQLLIAVDYDNHCETSGSNCGSLHLIEREYWKIRGNNKIPQVFVSFLF